jgi:hypothetical protein
MWTKIRHNPVAALTTLVSLLVALDAALEPLGVLTAQQSAIAGGVIAVSTAILGAITHGKVTPLARPRDNGGRPLVPLTTVNPARK